MDPIVTETLNIPPDVSPGALIGHGGCNHKKLLSKYRVRCEIQRENRLALITGTRQSVDGAIEELQRMFEDLRASSRPRVSQFQRAPRVVHRLAVLKRPEPSTWRFERRPQTELSVDPTVEDYEYRLIQTPSSDSSSEEEDGDIRPTWIASMNQAFVNEMIEQCAIEHDETVAGKMKLRLVFGMPCFSLLNEALGGDTSLTWNGLRVLRMRQDFMTRWSNLLNGRSTKLSRLIDTLEAQYTNETVFTHELMVYIDPRTSTVRDLSVKYRWESGRWKPTQRLPVRHVWSLSNFIVDNETAFRVRVYSREVPHGSDAVRAANLPTQLEVSTPNDDPFNTEVSPSLVFPEDLRVRSYAVKRKTKVEWRGLRFTISYIDREQRHASIGCRLARIHDEADPSVPFADMVRATVETVLQRLDVELQV